MEMLDIYHYMSCNFQASEEEKDSYEICQESSPYASGFNPIKLSFIGKSVHFSYALTGQGKVLTLQMDDV